MLTINMVKIGNIELGDFPVILAPMEDITDPPFRIICKKLGADLVYSEFISSDGLIRNAGKSIEKMEIFDEERPIAIQIFGNNIDSMKEATDVVARVNPEIIDINFGCSVKKIVAKESGAGMLKNIPKMLKMAEAVVKSTEIPVTVKTRLGWDENSIKIVEIVEALQDVGIKAVAIHARTAKQLYKGNADWSWYHKIKENQKIQIPVFGNGDIDSPEKALEMKMNYPVDGIMIGRATIGNPWIFREIKNYLKSGKRISPPGIRERVETCRTHFLESLKWKGERLTIFEMRKHYGSYFKGYVKFKQFKIRLVEELSIDGILELLNEIETYYHSRDLPIP